MDNISVFLHPRQCKRPYTVSEINEGIAYLIESGNTVVWVEGEISNWRPSSQGHFYFYLKDEQSKIPAVMWRSSVEELQFNPEDGIAVTVIASIRVYKKGGYYQLDVHRMQPIGQGALFIAFQKLKAKLEREGLFDPAHKKPLPPTVNRIGVVTSKSGAAIRDIVKIVSSRAPQTDIVLFDVLVQGESAPLQIVNAIKCFNEYGKVDCIIVARGGGSVEDLQAFNEEIVARAIFNSKIPIISAVGHEIDFTIADFVADIRAPTPSAAAQIAVADSEENRRVLQMLFDRFKGNWNRFFRIKQEELKYYETHYSLRKTIRFFLEKQQNLHETEDRISISLRDFFKRTELKFSSLCKQLNALSPLMILGRGYSIVKKKDGSIVRYSSQLKEAEIVELKFHRGGASAQILNIIKEE